MGDDSDKTRDDSDKMRDDSYKTREMRDSKEREAIAYPTKWAHFV